MMQTSVAVLVGLALSAPAVAEPLVEGRVRLASGQAATAAQVLLFDLTDLRRGPVARATTDAAGYFALASWAALRCRRGLRWGKIIRIHSILRRLFRINCRLPRRCG